MRYYLDTEFIERGYEHPIELISVGLVCEDGAELYAVLKDGWDRNHCTPWHEANVLPLLGDSHWTTRATLKQKLLAFIDKEPEFWGYYSAYDWVLFCQLFGRLIDMPTTWPTVCLDVKQLSLAMGNIKIPKNPKNRHNALGDARWIKSAHEFLMQQRAAELTSP